MKARFNWAQAMRFVGSSRSGHRGIMNASPTPAEEATLRCSPMEMLLLRIGDCTVHDVIKIRQKVRLPVENVVVEFEAVRADEQPKVLTKIHASLTAADDVPLKKAEMSEITHEIKLVTGNAKPCLPISPSV